MTHVHDEARLCDNAITFWARHEEWQWLRVGASLWGALQGPIGATAHNRGSIGQIRAQPRRPVASSVPAVCFLNLEYQEANRCVSGCSYCGGERDLRLRSHLELGSP